MHHALYGQILALLEEVVIGSGQPTRQDFRRQGMLLQCADEGALLVRPSVTARGSRKFCMRIGIAWGIAPVSLPGYFMRGDGMRRGVVSGASR